MVTYFVSSCRSNIDVSIISAGMKRIAHPFFYRMLENIVEDTPEKSSGTYNRMDPTAFSKGEQDFEYGGKRFQFCYNDVTWGIEIEIYRYHVRFPKDEPNPDPKVDFWWRKQKIGGFYLDRDDKVVIPRQNGTKGLAFLLGRAFRHVLKPGFKSWKEIEYEKWMNTYCPDELHINPAGEPC